MKLMTLARKLEVVVRKPEGQWFDPRLQSQCLHFFVQDSEPLTLMASLSDGE